MVSGSLSVKEGDEPETRSPFHTYTEKFYADFPYYLSIGMTYDQYWNDDPWLVRYYRQADEMRIDRKNQEMWLQGMYIYEALCDVAPIHHAFAKKGTKPHPYATAPYPLNSKQRERNEEAKEKANAEKGKRYMEEMMSRINRKFEGKENHS